MGIWDDIKKTARDAYGVVVDVAQGNFPGAAVNVVNVVNDIANFGKDEKQASARPAPASPPPASHAPANPVREKAGLNPKTEETKIEQYDDIWRARLKGVDGKMHNYEFLGYPSWWVMKIDNTPPAPLGEPRSIDKETVDAYAKPFVHNGKFVPPSGANGHGHEHLMPFWQHGDPIDPNVREMQLVLGVKPDGRYGNQTETAYKNSTQGFNFINNGVLDATAVHAAYVKKFGDISVEQAIAQQTDGHVNGTRHPVDHHHGAPDEVSPKPAGVAQPQRGRDGAPGSH